MGEKDRSMWKMQELNIRGSQGKRIGVLRMAKKKRDIIHDIPE